MVGLFFFVLCSVFCFPISRGGVSRKDSKIEGETKTKKGCSFANQRSRKEPAFRLSSPRPSSRDLVSSSQPRALSSLLGALEEENVGLWLVNHVVLPPHGLLHAQLAPLVLVHQAVPGNQLREVLGQDHVAVLELVVIVLVAVQNLVLHLGDELLRKILLHGIRNREKVNAVR